VNKTQKMDASNARSAVEATQAASKIARMDGWISAQSGSGGTHDKSNSYSLKTLYVSPSFAWSFYSTSGVAKKCVERPIVELMRPGWSLQIPGNKKLSTSIVSQSQDLHFDTHLSNALIYSRICGGAVIYLHTSDPDLSKPMSTGAKIIRLHTFSAGREVFGAPSITSDKTMAEAINSLSSESFGLPPYYSIRLPYVQFENVHHSRFIRFTQPSSVSDIISNYGFGPSLYETLYEPIQDYEVLCKTARQLGEDYAQAVFTMPGLDAAITKFAAAITNGTIPAASVDPLTSRLKELDRRRHTSRAIVLDGGENGEPAETFERKPTPVTGFGDLYTAAKERISLVAEIPQSQLFGTGSSGALNNGQENTDSFRASVLGIQTRQALPAIERFVGLLMGKTQPKSWTVSFNSPHIPSQKEVAETHKTQADADMLYIQMGLNPKDVLKSRFGGEAYSLDTMITEVPKEDILSVDPQTPAI